MLLFKNLEFIYTVFDLIDKKLEKLSEHNQPTVNLRHKCYKHAALYAKKIFITNNQRKKIFIKNYNCFSKKIFTIQFPPSVCLNRLESKKVKINFADKTIDTYIFYPAQYWSHKNHSYVIKSMIKFRSNKLKKLGCIFTGHDKGQLSYLKEYAKKIGINKKIIFYNYLSNNQLVYLYKHCFCVLFPSLIGFDSFPLYEAFYFKKMIIYNKNIIDKLFIKNIIPLNVSKNYDLEKKILFLKKNNRIFKKILIKNNKLYKKNFSQLQIQFNNLIVN